MSNTHRLVVTEAFLRDVQARLWSEPRPWLEFPLGLRRHDSSFEWTAPVQSNSDEPAGVLRVRLLPEGLRSATYRFFEVLASDAGVGPRVELSLFHGRGCVGAALIDGRAESLDQVWLQGPRMEGWSPGSGAPILEGRVPATGRFSRYQGALGGDAVHDRLRDLPIAVIGVSRMGSLFAVAAARAGVRRLVLVDPDVLEDHHLDAFEAGRTAREGEFKVHAMTRFLREIAPDVSVTAIATGVESPIAERALLDARVLVTAPDRGQPRLLASLLASSGHRVHLDLGAGVLGGVVGGGGRDAEDRMFAGADVRLILPGARQGCLLCAGGLDLTRRHEADWRRERAGSLRSLNGMAVSLGWFLIERLVAGDLQRSQWTQLRFDRTGRLTTTEPESVPRADCGVCGAAGLGEAAWSRAVGAGDDQGAESW